MRIKSISVQGFRGFNKERTIDLNPRLTLIYGPNSYGKTSISEALEWLLYGRTSRVEGAESKEEYKGSYRNPHLLESLKPFVQVCFLEGDDENEFAAELLPGDTIKRIVNGEEVEQWPLTQDLFTIPRPFVLQHALKDLLLAKPDERFQRFARILGLEELDLIHRNVISLCTKPQAGIPVEADQLLKSITALESRLASQASLAAIGKALKRGTAALSDTYSRIMAECRKRVPAKTPDQSILPQLLKIREEAVGKIFKGRITLHDFSSVEKESDAIDEEFLQGCVTETFVEKYSQLTKLATIGYVLDRARFFGLGVELLKREQSQCPFCGQAIDEILSRHIVDEHDILAKQTDTNKTLEEQRGEVSKALTELTNRLTAYHTRHVGKVEPLLSVSSSLDVLGTILLPKHQMHFDSVKTALSQLAAAKQDLQQQYDAVQEALKKVDTSIAESREESALLKDAGDVILSYIAVARTFATVVSSNASTVADADHVLQYELDILAGTEDVSVLIELLEIRAAIEKKFEIEDILDGLKELRSTTDQFVANKVLKGISGELTAEVMEWYERIKTTGDPDVHFGGFDLERTAKGGLRARRVQIKALSYGKELASAVSSLSESKLNALGLSVSIATNLKANSPFEFLVIDDPIQSWDAEHELQFIEVIRELVARGKQVVLLSHRREWIQQVRSGCRMLNGWLYEITGYTKAGPHISEVPWEDWKERLKAVDAIAKDSAAGGIRLQQAEEEIRIVVAELASELYRKTKGIQKSPHNLNSSSVRKMLLECGVGTGLIDRISQTFETTDAAHHAGMSYAPLRERIKRYHSWAHELAQLVS